MTSPHHSVEPVRTRHRSGRTVGRALLGLVLGLAVIGAAALVFTDDVRWLRLGIVAALWAALVGAFAAARYRNEVAADRDRGHELRRVYQLELEREVAARREYELELESDTRRRVETEVRGELDGLRAELRTLSQNLEALLGGEVLVERVALRAESTRLRSLADQPAGRSALPSGSPAGAAHDPTRGPMSASARSSHRWNTDTGSFPGVRDGEVLASRAEPHHGTAGSDRAPAARPAAEHGDPTRVDRLRHPTGQHPVPAEPVRLRAVPGEAGGRPVPAAAGGDPRDTLGGLPREATAGQSSLRTSGGQPGLRTPNGQPSLRTPGGQPGLRTPRGQPSLRTPGGQPGPRTPSGQPDPRTSNGQPAQPGPNGRPGGWTPDADPWTAAGQPGRSFAHPQRTGANHADLSWPGAGTAQRPAMADPTDILPTSQSHTTAAYPTRRDETTRPTPVEPDPPLWAALSSEAQQVPPAQAARPVAPVAPVAGPGGRRRRADDDEPGRTGGRRRRDDSGSHAAGRSVDELLASVNEARSGGRRHRREGA